MKLLQDVEKMSKSLKCYNGLNGARQTNTGFVVALKISEKVLDLSAKGHRERKMGVSVSRNGVEYAIDYRGNTKDGDNIVGLSQITNACKSFIKANNLSSIGINLSLLEIQGHSRMYIQLADFSFRR